MTIDPTVLRPPSKQARPPDAELAYQGKLFSVWQWPQRLFDGTTATFESLSRPDTVLVLPIRANGDAVFIDEKQPGMGSMLRTIGGRIEIGEDPCTAARRELREETGLAAAELRLWSAWQPVNKIDWAVYLFVAHGISDGSAVAMDAGEQASMRHFRAKDLLNARAAPRLDDYEFLHMLNFARSNATEKARVRALLKP